MGPYLESQVVKIQEASSKAEVTISGTFERLTKESAESLDDRIAKIRDASSQSEISLTNAFQKLTKETEGSLDGHIEAIHSVTSQAGDVVSSVVEDLENLKQDFVHSLDGCAEKIQDANTQASDTATILKKSTERFKLEIDSHVEQIEKANAHAVDTISSIAVGLEKTVVTCGERIEGTGSRTQDALSLLVQGLENTTKQTGESMSVFAESIDRFNTEAEEKLTSFISHRLDRAKVETEACMDTFAKRIEEVSNHAGEKSSSLVENLDRMKKECGNTIDTYVQKIEVAQTRAAETLLGFVPELNQVFEMSLTRHESTVRTLNNKVIAHHQDLNHGIKLDMIQWNEKKEDATKNLMQQFETLTAAKHLARRTELENWEQKKRDELNRALDEWNIAFDGKMRAAVESFHQRLEVHGRTIQSVALTSKEEMVERYVTMLQTCSEERQAYVKDLRLLDGRLRDVEQMLSVIATEIGCSVDPFMSSSINLPDSPIKTPSFENFPSTSTIKSRFEETSDGISEILDFCNAFRMQVNDLSNAVFTTLGVPPVGESVMTMLATNIFTTESLLHVIGAPKHDSSLWDIMEGFEESRKMNGEAYQRFHAIFQETRGFISNANSALGYVPIALHEISDSAAEITDSVVASQAFAAESKTITDSLSLNLRTTVDALASCIGNFELMDKAIRKTKDLVLDSKKSAESGNAIVSDMQEILLETSRSVGEMVTTTSGISKSVEMSKATVEGFRTEIEFFKDSVQTTKESIDGSSALTNIYQEDVKAIDVEFKTAAETLKHVTESISTLCDSVSGVRLGMDHKSVTVSETRRTIENLNGNIGDAEYSIESFTASLTSFSELIESAGASFAQVSATIDETLFNVKKLNKGIRRPEYLVEDLTASVTTLTEVAKAAENSIAHASTLLLEKAKDVEDAKVPDAVIVATHEEDQSFPEKDSVAENMPALPVSQAVSSPEDGFPGSPHEPAISNPEDTETKVLDFPNIEDPRINIEPDNTTPQKRQHSSPIKRRGIGSLFSIPQWMSTPSTSAIATTPVMSKDLVSGLPTSNTGTSTTIGLTRKDTIVDVLRRDRIKGVGGDESRDVVIPLESSNERG